MTEQERAVHDRVFGEWFIRTWFECDDLVAAISNPGHDDVPACVTEFLEGFQPDHDPEVILAVMHDYAEDLRMDDIPIPIRAWESDPRILALTSYH